jgi:hypothetical protein
VKSPKSASRAILERMSPLKYEDIRDIPLTNDDELHRRVVDLLERAFRRQLWLMFLDEEDCPLPFLMPTDVARRPEKRDTRRLSRFLREAAWMVEASSMVAILERPGSDELGPDDMRWFRVLQRSARAAQVPLRAHLLCHANGVRLVHAEEVSA